MVNARKSHKLEIARVRFRKLCTPNIYQSEEIKDVFIGEGMLSRGRIQYYSKSWSQSLAELFHMVEWWNMKSINAKNG